MHDGTLEAVSADLRDEVPLSDWDIRDLIPEDRAPFDIDASIAEVFPEGGHPASVAAFFGVQ